VGTRARSMRSPEMSTLSDALRAIAARCRYWSGQVMELGAAKEFRTIATELDQKAQECKGVECPAPAPSPQIQSRSPSRGSAKTNYDESS
jgi:hypothetical protein